MKPLFISHYTRHTPYAKEVQRLINSLELFELDYDIQPSDPRGSWMKNTKIKNEFICAMMDKYRNREALVWVDADAEILLRPLFLERMNPDVDLSYHRRYGWEALGGTIYIKNDERMRLVWAMCSFFDTQYPTVRSQSIMAMVYELFRSLVRYEPMPEPYCQIFDAPSSGPKSPVIIHNQASRRFKKAVEGVTGPKLKILKGKK